MSAFNDGEGRVAWCNLCRARGDTFQLDALQPEWMADMDIHTRLRHPEHDAALRRGEPYLPVEVDP